MKVIENIAKVVGAVFYPLWIPTYGMLLFCIAMAQWMSLPWNYWLVTIGSTLLLTALLPLSLILYQVHRGDIDDIYIHKKEQRTLAYAETVGGFLCWWYLLAFVLHAPQWLCGVALGGTIAIAVVALINRWWKISAHLTGMGGLVGGIFSYQLSGGSSSFLLPLCAILLAWLVMLARLYLNAHSAWQVIAGFALGLGSTCFVSWLYV